MSFEFQMLDIIQELRTPFLDVAMMTISGLGNAGFLWILMSLFLIIRKKTRRAGVILLLALCMDALLCNVLLKPLVARVRPCDVNTAVELLIPHPTDKSFPSGHTAASFAAVSALYFSGEKSLWKVSLALAVWMAFSRMYLYVHYPTDVLGGAAVGGLSGYGAFLGIRYLERLRKSE